MKVPFQGRTTYHDTFCFVEPCFGLWFDGCTCKNPVHSVSFPIPVFRDTSGLLLLLGLDFSAMIFPVVHIGAIAVSFLFVVMMFHIQIAETHEEVLRYLPVSSIIGLILALKYLTYDERKNVDYIYIIYILFIYIHVF